MNDENGNGDGNGKVQFQRKDGVEKDGFICFPVETPTEQAKEVEGEERAMTKTTPPISHVLETCPEDPRYQQENKTTWCYRMYVDYHRCRHLLGEKAKQCDYFYKCYHSICPNAWHERWDEQMKAGTFPRNVTKEMPCPKPAPCP